MFWKDLLLVALGSALGGALRYSCSFAAAGMNLHPVAATLTVNIAGSFLIGLVAGLCDKGGWQSFASVGFCGGFTTCSTLSLQSFRLLQSGKALQASAYMAGTLALCLLATWAGLAVAKAARCHA